MLVIEERSIKIPALFAILAAAVQFAVNLSGGYGYFRDELYYIICTQHLAWGYVDQPPFSIAMLAISRFLFGDSLVAIRLFPALANGVLVFITGVLARCLGGGRFAQALCCMAVLIAPQYLGIFNYFSMNSFDLLFWAVGFFLVIKIIQTQNEKLWIVFGIVAGIGLLNKLSMLFFLFGLVVGFLFTEHRKQLLSKWFWAGAVIAAAIFTPHILWQVRYHWPTLEFMRNATQLKNARVSVLDFFAGQVMTFHPVNTIIWIPGFLFLFSKRMNPYRLFAIAYIALFVVFVVQHGKPYYLSPFYPILFASGAIAIETFIARRNWNLLKPILLALLLIAGIGSAPFALPVLPVETYIRYAKALGMAPKSEERDRPGKLDQHYADMFGWKEMAETVNSVYQKLSPEEKKKCVVFAQNYGEAAAIDFFGKKYGLHAISGHNSYYLWGYGNATGEVVIVIAGNEQDLKDGYQRYYRAAVIRNEYARSFETDLPVYVCFGLKRPISEVWPSTREFI